MKKHSIEFSKRENVQQFKTKYLERQHSCYRVFVSSRSKIGYSIPRHSYIHNYAAGKGQKEKCKEWGEKNNMFYINTLTPVHSVLLGISQHACHDLRSFVKQLILFRVKHNLHILFPMLNERDFFQPIQFHNGTFIFPLLSIYNYQQPAEHETDC